MVSMIFFFLCHCFDSCLVEDIQSQRLYEIHAKSIQQCYRQCPWFLQTQQEVEQVRLTEQQSVQNLSAQIVESVMESWQSFWKKLVQQQIEQKRIEQARMLKKQQQIDKEVEQARIAKKQKEARLTIFACRRCSVKFSSNTKFHQHICDHHTKKSKFVVSSSSTSPASPPTSPESITILSDSPKSASQSKILFTFSTSSQSVFFSVDSLKSASQPKVLSISFSTFSTSIFSSNFSSKISSKPSSTAIKISLLSSSASEFVSKHSENTTICPFTPPSTSQKSARMQPTSLYNLSSKFYLTVDDLFRMFVEKSKSIDLQQHQNYQFFSRIFDISKRDFMQMRIIFYFLLVKTTKSEVFTSVHDSIKQSIRTSSSRSSSSRSSSSIRFLFSTSLYFSPVCWRCQEPFVICLFRNWAGPIAARVEILMRRRGRRLFV